MLVYVLALAFGYAVSVDPFTDAPTHEARIGNAERNSVAVLCGDRTDWKLAIEITASFQVEHDTYTPLSGRLQPVRFDDDEPREMRFHYRPAGNVVMIFGEDAAMFSDGLLTKSRVRFRVSDYREQTYLFDLPTHGAESAVARVRRECLWKKAR